ncbi:uncharacterized protein HGUI_02533 [Hanseniaspora guilliermondii]|uniref:Uncharacterized protein n=1 Tax=Hanseniaspora guilliermondii TaxID=56406 RepID=A0A1L0CN80_9ASCO|nr:uncharacterized protein HGUI_02533 [Hanseniaspora guilliermondii]
MSNVVVDKYDLQLIVDPKKNEFDGLVTIYFEHPPCSDITLNSQGLKIEQYQYNTSKEKKDTPPNKAKFFVDKTQRTVTFPVKSFDDDIKSMTIVYRGPIDYINKPGMKTQGIFKTNILDNKTNKQTFFVSTNCQPFSYIKLFPGVLNNPQKVKFDFTLVYPSNEDYKAVSNTEIIEKSVVDNNIMVKFAETPYMLPSVFGFCLGKLEFLETFVDEMPLRLYTPCNVEEGAFCIDAMKECFMKLKTIFFKGFEYPLKKLDFVALPFLHCYATENFGMVSIMANNILMKNYDESMHKTMKIIIAHEMVHQWVGNRLSFKQEHTWFNESFATFAAMKVLYPQEAEDYDLVVDKLYNHQIKEKENVMQDLDASSFDMLEHDNYTKGVLIIRYIVEAYGMDKLINAIVSLDKKNTQSCVEPDDIFLEMGCLDLYLLLKNGTNERMVLSINEDNIDMIPKGINIPLLLNNDEVCDLDMLDLPTCISKNIVSFKRGNYGLFRVHYNNSTVINNLINSMDSFNELEILSILDDLKFFIGDYKSDVIIGKNDLLLPFLMIEKFSMLLREDEFIADYNECLITLLPIIQSVFTNLHSHDVHDINTFMNIPIKKTILALFKTFKNQVFKDDKFVFDFKKCAPSNYTVMSQLLPLINEDEVDEFTSSIFKTWSTGRPIKSKIPIELIYPSLLTHVEKINQTKDWKKVYQMFLKTQNYMSILDTSNVSVEDFQNYIFASFKEVSEELYMRRLLEYIFENFYEVDLTHKLSLLLSNGNKQFNNSELKHKDLFWEYYVKHFDKFIMEMRTKQKKWTNVASNNFIELSQSTFGSMIDTNINEVEQFVALKESKYGKSMISEVLDLKKKMHAKNNQIYVVYLSDKYDM